MTENEVRIALQKAINAAGNHTTFARMNDLDRTCLFPILSGKRPPGPQVLRALKIRRYYVYEPA